MQKVSMTYCAAPSGVHWMLTIKGWVVADWKQSENNRRARFYRLTPAGKKQLAAEIAEFERVMGAIGRVIQPA